MSAYVVDKATMDALVRAAIDHRTSWTHGAEWTRADQMEPDALGQMLTDANVASVGYRYPDDSLTTLPGRLSAWWVLPYRYRRPTAHHSPVVLLKAVSCYEYQSCESPDWDGSGAERFCASLRADLIRSLPGYDAAPWGIDDDEPEPAPPTADADWWAWRQAFIPGGE